MVSCAATEEPQPVEGSGTVVLNVSLASTEGGSRSGKADDYLVNTPTYLGDEYIDVLYYQVFDVSKSDAPVALYDNPMVATDFKKDGSTSIEFQIPSTGSFNIVFWAQHNFTDTEIAAGEKNPYTIGNLSNIKVDYDAIGTNNNNKVSAFYATTGALNSATATSRNVYLTRAVAQVNVGMSLTGYNDLKSDYKPQYSTVKFTGLKDQINLLTGKTSFSDGKDENSVTTFARTKNIAATYDDGVNSAEAETFKQNVKQYRLTTHVSHDENTNTTVEATNATDYAWVSMCYVLAPNEVYAIPAAEFSFYSKDDDSSFKQVVRTTNVPITSNYRTNIISTLTGKVTTVVQTAYYWAGNQTSIIKLTAADFAKLANQTDTDANYIDYSNYDLVIDLSDAGATGVAAPMKKNVTNTTTDTPLKIKANSITLQNGTISSGAVHFVSTGKITITNVKFTGNASNYGTRIMIGDGTFDDDQTGDEYSPEIVIDNVDFSGSEETQTCITIDGGITTPTNKASIADNGTYKLTISNSKFANFKAYAIQIVGMRNNGTATISDCDFKLPYVGYMYEPARGIELFNDNGASGVSVEVSSCTFEYSEFPTDGTKNYRAGLVGLSGLSKEIGASGDYDWKLSSWSIKFKDINGTNTAGTALTDLGIGTAKSLLSLQGSLYETSWFPQSVYLNDQVVNIPFDSYPTDYFKK